MTQTVSGIRYVTVIEEQAVIVTRSTDGKSIGIALIDITPVPYPSAADRDVSYEAIRQALDAQESWWS